MKRIGKNRLDLAPAFVCGLGSNGLSFLRSLGRRGIPVVAVDVWNAPEMSSRYTIPAVVPDPSEDEQGLLRFFLETGESLPTRTVLLPTNDAFVLFIAKYSERLSKFYDFNVADHATIMTLANKKLQYEYARRQGIPIPLTFYPSEQPIEEIGRVVNYPCIIKPCFSHLWKKYLEATWESRWGKVAEVHSKAELVDTLSSMERSGIEMMVQEKTSGGPGQLHDLLVYFDRASEPLALFTKRKIRIYPLDFGVSSIAIGEWDPEVARLGLKFAQGMRFKGAMSPEFKRDPNDGELKLMEVNPRSILTTGLAVASGVDIPYIAYRDARGEPVEKVTSFHEGVKWISFQRDFSAYLEYRKLRRLSFGSWLSSWKGPRCFSHFARDDPMPACMGTYSFVRDRFLSWLSAKRRTAS